MLPLIIFHMIQPNKPPPIPLLPLQWKLRPLMLMKQLIMKIPKRDSLVYLDVVRISNICIYIFKSTYNTSNIMSILLLM